MKETVKLLRPLYNKEVVLELGFSKNLMIYGPYVLVKKKQYKSALLHIIFTLMTFGYYWYWFAKNHNSNFIISLLNKGWTPATSKDVSILKSYDLRKTTTNSDYIGVSRLGSVDKNFGKDTER